MKIYTSREVAGILKVSITQVYHLIWDGQLVAKKVGKGYRISDKDLEAYFLGGQEPEDEKEPSGIIVTAFDNEAAWMVQYAGIKAPRKLSVTAKETEGKTLYGVTRNMRAMNAAEQVFVMELPTGPRKKRIAEMTPEELQEAGAKLVAYRVVKA